MYVNPVHTMILLKAGQINHNYHGDNYMKTTIVSFLLLILFINKLHSQNAYSDALLIEKNKSDYILKLDNLIALIKNVSVEEIPAFKGKQDELQTLLDFIKNPWNPDIGTYSKLNINVVSNLSKQINNLSVKKTELMQSIENHKAKISDFNKNIKLVQNDDSLYSKKIADITSNINIEDLQLKADEKELKLIENVINSPSIVDFSNMTQKTKDAVSLLGKTNSDNVQDVKVSQPFKLNESAVIEAIVNTIMDEMAKGVAELLFDNILNIELTYNIPKNSSTGTKDKEKSDEVKSKIRSELKVIFPESIKTLDLLKKNGEKQNYTNLSNTLKHSFNNDLKKILINLSNETTSENYNESQILKHYRDNNKSIFNYFKTANSIVDNIKNGFHPVDIISLLNENLSPGDFGPYKKYIAIIDIFQSNLRELKDDSKNVWISYSGMNDLKAEVDNTSASYFIGFIYQYLKIKDDETSKNLALKLKGYFAPNDTFEYTKFDKIKLSLKHFLIHLNKIENNIKSINLSKENNSSVESYLDNINILFSMTDDLKPLLEVFIDKEKLTDVYKQADSVNQYVQLSFSVYKSINEGNYASVVPTVLDILINKCNVHDTYSDYYSNKDNKSKFVSELAKYTSFAVDLTNAKSQDDLNNAVNKAVGNWGGLLRKQENNFVVSVNSYPGFVIGNERINNNTSNPLINNYAFTMPLGINFQLTKNLGKIAVFGQLFDLAAAVNVNNGDNNTTTVTPNLTFNQFISPGAFLSVEPWNKFPISFNLGGAILPELRSNGDKPVDKSYSVRYSFGITYDVPLWHIFSSNY